jgi:hypothetical protein
MFRRLHAVRNEGPPDRRIPEQSECGQAARMSLKKLKIGRLATDRAISVMGVLSEVVES